MSVTSTIEVKRTKRGYRYYKLRKAFSKFYRKHSEFIDKQCWFDNSSETWHIGAIVELVFDPLSHDTAF